MDQNMALAQLRDLPNKVLARLRELTARVNDGTGRVDAEEFAEQFAALDGWLTQGGFMPDDWIKPYRRPTQN